MSMNKEINEKIKLDVLTKEIDEYASADEVSLEEIDEYELPTARNIESLPEPTEEEARTLRRVMGTVPWSCYIICLIELAERGSYYGTGDRLSNFIQQSLPPNSPHGTGAVAKGDTESPSGALGLGLQKASALTLLLTFFAYVTPLFGGYLADKKWGRFKTLWLGVWVGCLSHIIFLIAAIPKVISSNHGIVAVTIGILCLACGSGLIKPNLLPLLMDQYPYPTDVVKTLHSGERVILDRDASLQRVTGIFYWSINVGSFLSLGTSYAARNVGFWLAWLAPMILYMLMFPVLWLLDSRLTKQKPSGKSVLEDSLRVIIVSFESGWFNRLKTGTFWEYAKPSNLESIGRTSWRKNNQGTFGYNDQFVEDVKHTLDACKIFFFYIIYNINDGGLGSLQNSQAASLTANNVPNDLINNFNPLTIIILMPILDSGLYPLLRKLNINYRPVYRIFTGFVLAALSSLAGAIIQWRIYKISPCGNKATSCKQPAPLSLWIEVVLYVLAAASECFANTTIYQVAYTRAPSKMKGFVMALQLFTSAISAAIGEGATGAMVDPKLPGIFLGLFIAGVALAILFLFMFRNLHIVMEKERHEKEENMRAKIGFKRGNPMPNDGKNEINPVCIISPTTSAIVAYR